MRSTFIKTLISLAEQDERIFVITPDLGFSVLEEFEQKFPNRFLNVGIAESNAISIAAGLALSGKIVYVYSIMPFVTMRPYEQIRVDVAYMNTNVRLVGVGAGLTYGPAGATHHSIEDLAIMRVLPNMTVLAPSDPLEVEKLLQETVTHSGPIYFRLAKKGEPILTPPENIIQVGVANPIFESDMSDISILFTSNASDLAIEVAQKLREKKCVTNLYSMHSIKPFDYATLNTILESGKPIFTIEEHSLIGGLGSIVAEYIAESKYAPVFKRFGLPDQYSHYVGDQNYIRGKFGLTAPHIYDAIAELI